MRIITVLFAAALVAGSAQAQQPAVTHQTEGPFSDVAFAVESAIIGEGLVIDHESHVGAMLARTKEDVGGERDLFTEAIVYTFCSATASREVIEADITNVQYCPYGIFVYEEAENPGTVTVGYTEYPGDSMAPVRELLDGIVKSALDVE